MVIAQLIFLTAEYGGTDKGCQANNWISPAGKAGIED
jgi:hypothetical protein